MALSAPQARRIAATFAHVDGLLDAAERLASAESSPFARERADLAEAEVRLVRLLVAQARAGMLAALDRLDIARPQPTRSARWSIDTSLTYADIALAELDARTLRGYGAVDPDAAGELAALAGDLRALLARGKALLHEHEAGALQDALAALPGPAGDVLRGVYGVCLEHGLAELHPLIAAAAERAVATTLDVGVFGRVSAGKSSLINALVGEPLLPVGATPVTAAPTRVAHGDAGATIHFVDGTSATVPVTALPDFVTEAHNPSNARAVRAVDVRSPAVPVGVRLLDTPGVGSLSSAGAALSFAWLPRCDLGLVLIAAGDAVDGETLALVSGLHAAGIACDVLLSKADLLDGDERQAALVYVARELRAVLREDAATVRPVSAAPAHTESLHALRRDVIEPMAASRDHASRALLGSRLRALVAAADAALSARHVPDAESSIDTARARVAAEEVVRRITNDLASGAASALDGAARAVAAAWRRGEDGRAAARAALLEAAAVALGEIRRVVDGLTPVASGRERRMPPLFDAPLLDALPALAPPRLGVGRFGLARARRRLRPLAQPLAEALSRYAARLHGWACARVAEAAENAAGDHPGDPASVTAPRNPELARLGQLIAKL